MHIFGTFVMLKFKNKLDKGINYHGKCVFALKLIRLSNDSNLCPLEIAQKCNVANFVYYGKNTITVLFGRIHLDEIFHYATLQERFHTLQTG